MDDYEALAGERLMIGIPGPSARPEDIALFRETHAGGLILYRRNFESPEQLLRLLLDLETALERRLLVATDHEGGRVIMLGNGTEGTTVFPDNLAIGHACREAEGATFAQGLIEGQELRRLGVDLNLGPCLDVLTDVYSPNIGIRSYGTDPALVARLGAARITGMAQVGLSACAKHFPGKGHSPLDAHLALARIESTWDEMRATHLPPFLAAIAAGVDAVMTSHPVYPNLDPEAASATFSSTLVGVLRQELGFGGVVVSDDLEMGAIRAIATVGEAAVRAAAAGHDLLLVCHTPEAQREAHHALVEAYRGGRLTAPGLELATARVRSLRQKRVARTEGGMPALAPGGRDVARDEARKAVRILRAGPKPVTPFDGLLHVVFPRLSEVADRITVEPALLDEARFLEARLGTFGVLPQTRVVGLEPTGEEIAEVAARAKSADAPTLLFLLDAHLYPSNRLLLDALLEARSDRSPLAVVLLRDPWDAELLPEGVLGITAFGYRLCQLEAVIERLFSPG